MGTGVSARPSRNELAGYHDRMHSFTRITQPRGTGAIPSFPPSRIAVSPGSKCTIHTGTWLAISQRYRKIVGGPHPFAKSPLHEA